MSSPLADRVTGPIIITGALVAVAGIGIFFGLPHTHDGSLVTAFAVIATIFGGIGIQIVGLAIHDRSHRRRGETPHAWWGTADSRRPSRLDGPPR